jgi:hypothetical protein
MQKISQCARWHFVRNEYKCLLLFIKLQMFPVMLHLVIFRLVRLLDPLILSALTRKCQAVHLVRQGICTISLSQLKTISESPEVISQLYLCTMSM